MSQSFMLGKHGDILENTEVHVPKVSALPGVSLPTSKLPFTGCQIDSAADLS